MNGRRVIKTSVREITADNVVDVLQKALGTHELNRSEIDYLWNYYRGKQPILHRTKEVRPEICNKIVENRANEIVSFKVGYLCGEPIQYVGRNGEEATAKAITALNELMFAEDKATKSQVLVSMLQQTKIHPLLAFQHSGLFVDPESAYTMSMAYYEEQQTKLEEQSKSNSVETTVE